MTSKELKGMILNNKIEEAMQEIVKIIPDLDHDMTMRIDIVVSQVKELEKNRFFGTISSENIDIQRNRVVTQSLTILNDLKKKGRLDQVQ